LRRHADMPRPDPADHHQTRSAAPLHNAAASLAWRGDMITAFQRGFSAWPWGQPSSCQPKTNHRHHPARPANSTCAADGQSSQANPAKCIKLRDHRLAAAAGCA
jgi:hypothetical protein